jgi:hypothetical protein
MTTVYAIRERNTDRYLPAMKMIGSSSRVRHRGFSFTDPVSGQAPRLFYTKQSARNALTAWLQGTWKTETVRSGFYGEDTDVYTVPTKVEGRKRELMEIVEFNLVKVGNVA